MAAEAQIPPFPKNFETVGNTEYTEVFEKLHKNKTTTQGATTNPRDPIRKPENTPPVAHKSRPNPRVSESPLHHESGPRKLPVSPLHQQLGGTGSTHRKTSNSTYPTNKPTKKSANPNPNPNPSTPGRGTPGRSKGKHSARGYENPQEEDLVPPFASWDDANPASGDNFTGIFAKYRDEKLSPKTPIKALDNPANRDSSPVPKRCFCFGI